jgi:outer membrane protein insertion porin family
MNIGHIAEINATRSCHRYALGGDGSCMRGFDSYGIAPRDKNRNSVGGNKFWTLSFMVKAPLSTREMGINGVAFVDFGSAWGSKYDPSRIVDSSSIRSSAGVAIEWAKSPLGVPLSFVFGFPLKKQKFDEKQTFTLTGFM